MSTLPDSQPPSPGLSSSQRQVNTKAIAVSGEFDQASADELDALIWDAENADIKWILIDLSDVSFIDSTGLSMLLDAKRRSNGRLSFMPSKHEAVTRMLELTGTIEILG